MDGYIEGTTTWRMSPVGNTQRKQVLSARPARSIALRADAGVSRAPQWTQHEDDMWRLVHMHGTRSWTLVLSTFPGRTGKQCRALAQPPDHDIRRCWSIQEDRMLLELHRKFGNR